MASMESTSFCAQSLLQTSAFCVAAVVFLLSVALQLWKCFTRRRPRSTQCSLSLPPGRLGLPFVGETLRFLQTRKCNAAWEFADERVAMYGEIFKTHLLGNPTIVASNPAGNKMLFTSVNKLVDVFWPASVVSVLGKHVLIALRGDAAKRIRHAMMTFLRPEALQLYTAKVDKIAQSFIQEHWEGKSEVTVYPLMKRFTFRVACELLMSRYEKEEQAMLEEPFTTMVKGIVQFPVNLPGTRYSKALAAAKMIRSRFQLWIDERRRDLAAGKASSNEDMLSCLLSYVDEDGKALSDEDIKENILLLLFAGHDTTLIVITMMCKFLALNPDIMDEVYKENEEISMGKGPNEPLSWADIQKLKLSWRVVQETMRLQPPIQGGFRAAIEDFEYSGFRIPKAWMFLWSTHSTHRNSKYFAEPSKFDPSRFEGAGPAPYTFVPFGGGPRMCPGNEFARMEALVILHRLVTHFSWTLVDPQEVISIDPMPYPKKGLPIRLHPRVA